MILHALPATLALAQLSGASVILESMDEGRFVCVSRLSLDTPLSTKDI